MSLLYGKNQKEDEKIFRLLNKREKRADKVNHSKNIYRAGNKQQMKQEIARKMKVKSRGEPMGFEQKWKVWQRQSEGKPSEKAINLRGYDKAKRRREDSKPIHPDDIPN